MKNTKNSNKKKHLTPGFLLQPYGDITLERFRACDEFFFIKLSTRLIEKEKKRQKNVNISSMFSLLKTLNFITIFSLNFFFHFCMISYSHFRMYNIFIIKKKNILSEG